MHLKVVENRYTLKYLVLDKDVDLSETMYYTDKISIIGINIHFV